MKDLFINRKVVGLTAIVLSLLICFGVTPLFNNALQSKVSVVRIVKDVKVGEQITSDKIQVIEIGGYNLPNTVLKNKVSNSPLSENKYLYELDGK